MTYWWQVHGHFGREQAIHFVRALMNVARRGPLNYIDAGTFYGRSATLALTYFSGQDTVISVDPYVFRGGIKDEEPVIAEKLMKSTVEEARIAHPDPPEFHAFHVPFDREHGLEVAKVCRNKQTVVFIDPIHDYECTHEAGMAALALGAETLIYHDANREIVQKAVYDVAKCHEGATVLLVECLAIVSSLGVA